MKTQLKSVSLVLAGALAGFVIAGALPSATNVSYAHSGATAKKLSADLAKMRKDIAKLKQTAQVIANKVQSNRKRITRNAGTINRHKAYINKWRVLPLH